MVPTFSLSFNNVLCPTPFQSCPFVFCVFSASSPLNPLSSPLNPLVWGPPLSPLLSNLSLSPLFSPTCPSLPSIVDGLREDELVRSGNREQKKKSLAAGSGSGEMDDVTELLAALPTVLYQEPSTLGA